MDDADDTRGSGEEPAAADHADREAEVDARDEVGEAGEILETGETSETGETLETGEIIEIPLEVDAARDGLRLDRFITSRITRLSRTRVQAIVGAGKVRRADTGERLLRPSIRVHVGQRLIVERPAPREPAVVLDYREIYRDDDLLVLDKPAGLPVHPSASYHRHTLTHLLRTRLGPGHGWELAHRIDRETSGVLVLGRRRGPAGPGSGVALKRAFLGRQVDKTYWALVFGELVGAQTIEIPLGPALGSQIRVKMGARARDDGGLEATTIVTPLAAGEFRGRPVTLVEAAPRTGRQHQIRVHLALVGHPVVGDKLYGIDEAHFLDVAEGRRSLDDLGDQLGIRRHALHARALGLCHPRTGERMIFTAPWPAELAAIIAGPAAAMAPDRRPA